MSTAPYEQAIAATRAVLERVTPDQLGQATPCASWTVADVIDHLVSSQDFFTAGLTGTPPTPGAKASAGDFVAEFDRASAACLEAFHRDGVMDSTVTLPFGEMPCRAVAGLAATDTFTHGWDLARATGQSTDLAPELAEGLLAAGRQAISPAFRGAEGAAPFGPEQEAPAGATNADRLAAFLGRSV